MRIAMLSAAILAASSLGLNAGAQSRNSKPAPTIKKEETVVIHKDGADKTVIEIRDGAVFVNGDEVASLQDATDRNLRKKIVIDNSAGGDPQQWSFNDDAESGRGSQRRAALGVFTDPSSRREGAAIKDVHPGSAADKAGLRKGDLITSVDGHDINSAEELVDAIARQHKPGDEVLIGYERGGSRRESRAVLTEAGPATAMRGFGMRPGDGMNMPGMPEGLFRSFSFPSSDDAAPRLGVSAEDRADGNGVRVLAVKPGSPAAEAGLREGDVLTRVDDESIGSVDELQMSVRSHKAGDRLELRYERSGKSATTAVVLPKELKRKDL